MALLTMRSSNNMKRVSNLKTSVTMLFQFPMPNIFALTFIFSAGMKWVATIAVVALVGFVTGVLLFFAQFIGNLILKYKIKLLSNSTLPPFLLPTSCYSPT